MMDVDVRWLGMPDFGFSKTLEETLGKWGESRLKDAMRAVIDDVDPDVIITNHSLTRGHGHHRASIWAVIECLKERAAIGEYVPQLYSRCGVDQAQLLFDPGQLDPACASMMCSKADVMNVLDVGLCGECLSDGDCQPGQTCTEAWVDLGGGGVDDLYGSKCE